MALHSTSLIALPLGTNGFSMRVVFWGYLENVQLQSVQSKRFEYIHYEVYTYYYSIASYYLKIEMLVKLIVENKIL